MERRGRPRTGRAEFATLNLRIEPELKKAIEAEAERRGQKLVVFVARTLRKELGLKES